MSHSHHHSRAHDHDHAGHGHAPQNFGTAFAVGVLLNAAFVVAELVFGYLAQSLALISDAVHNLSDVIALLLAWAAVWLAGRLPTDHPRFRLGRCRGAKVRSEMPLIAHTDGELFCRPQDGVCELEVELLPGRLRVLRRRDEG